MKSSGPPTSTPINPSQTVPSPVVHVRTALPDELEAVARVRSRCYDPSYAHLNTHLRTIADDRGQIDQGDFLLAERAGRLIGTATSLSGLMNVRGRLLPCQGVAWVGTTLDARRSGGVASAIMARLLDMARQRGEVLSSLMPFRASFYEHFGYGLCERRLIWKIPTAILPKADTGGFELAELDDPDLLTGLARCRRTQAERGHGDMIFPHADHEGMAHWVKDFRENSFLFVRRNAGGAIDAFVSTERVTEGDRRGLRCLFTVHQDSDGLRSILQFLATLRDQYGFIELATPADLPLNWLLRETQLPHRPVEHPHARCDVATRMQVRILDHLALLNGMECPGTPDGGAVVRVDEPEGHQSTFHVEINNGIVSAAPTQAAPDITLPARAWAAVVMGEIPASHAARLGFIAADADPALKLLDTFAAGPPPFCREFF